MQCKSNQKNLALELDFSYWQVAPRRKMTNLMSKLSHTTVESFFMTDMGPNKGQMKSKA